MLPEFIDIKQYLQEVNKDLQRFFRLQDHHLLTFHRSIQTIYEDELEIVDIPNIFLFPNKSRSTMEYYILVAKINAGRVNRDELKHEDQLPQKKKKWHTRTPASNIPCPACSFSN